MSCIAFSREWGVSGELTHDSTNMGAGFDDMDDSSPFLVEPTYDPQRGGWITKEMRAHLKILQTGTVNQVDLLKLKEEDISSSDDDAREIAKAPQLQTKTLRDSKIDKSLEDAVLETEPDDRLAAQKIGKAVAIQCTLLGDPLENDPPDWPNALGAGIQQRDSGICDSDAPKCTESCPGDQTSMASLTDHSYFDPLTTSGVGQEELAPSRHLVRLSNPIAWAQRKWLPFQTENDGR